MCKLSIPKTQSIPNLEAKFGYFQAKYTGETLKKTSVRIILTHPLFWKSMYIHTYVGILIFTLNIRSNLCFLAALMKNCQGNRNAGHYEIQRFYDGIPLEKSISIIDTDGTLFRPFDILSLLQQLYFEVVSFLKQI